MNKSVTAGKKTAFKTFCKNIYESSNFPFYVMLVLALMLHVFIIPNYGDDPVLQKIPFSEIFPWTFGRYAVHSSRTVIDFFMFIAAHIPVILWKLIDAVILTLLAKGISELFEFQKDRQMNWFIVGLVLLYPFRDMSTAGWIATVTNYLWPLTAGVFAVIPLRMTLKGQKISIKRTVISCVLLVYATSSELMCGALFGIYAVMLIYVLCKKKINLSFCIQLGIIAAMLAVHLLCPGNAARQGNEVDSWFKAYTDLSIGQKLEIGFSSTLYEYIMKPNYLFMILCLLVLINNVKKRRHCAVTAISCVPVIITAVFGFGLFDGVFKNILERASDSKWANIIMDIKYALTETGTNPDMHNIESLIPDAMLFVTVLCLAIGLVVSFNDKKKAWCVLLIIAAGFASRLVMAFSPTIWSSLERTFIFFYAAIIYACVELMNDIRGEKTIKISYAASIPFVLICSVSYISQLLYTVIDSMNL